MGKDTGSIRKPVKSVSYASGHQLTSTEKKAVVALINNGAASGRVGRTDYMVSLISGNTYAFKVRKNDRGLGFVGDQLRSSVYSGTITVRR